MENKEIKNNLINFYAFDTCGPDFGFKDDELRMKTFVAIESIHNEDEKLENKILSELLIEQFLCDEAINEGYGIEDVENFLSWYHECFYKYID